MKYLSFALIVISCLSFNSLFSRNVSYSQSGQDAFLYKKFFSNKTNGVFVDIGAHDGITYSNTYFFEKHLGWHGICVEPLPNIFAQLIKNRTCICVEGCIYDKADTVTFLQVQSTTGEHTEMLSGIVDQYDPKHLERIELETADGKGFYQEIIVKCYALNTILEKYKIYHVDYLSIDTEGGELDILKSIDFNRFTINVIGVENNYNDPAFEQFLKTKGYKKLQGTSVAGDEIYIRNEWQR